MLCDYLIDEQLFVSVENIADNFIGGGWHDFLPTLTCGPAPRRGVRR
jgi:hypothetical protein